MAPFLASERHSREVPLHGLGNEIAALANASLRKLAVADVQGEERNVRGLRLGKELSGPGGGGCEQRASRRGRNSEHHCIERFPVDQPALVGLVDEFDRDGAAGVKDSAVLLGGIECLGDKRLYSRLRRREDRSGSGGGGSGGAASCAPSREQHAAPGCESRDLWHLGKTEPVGVGGVDAADQRVDEPFVHFVAESCPNVWADRVGIGRRAWQERLEGGPRLTAPRDQSRTSERERIAGHSQHQACGDVVQLVMPHRRTNRLGVREVVAQANLGSECHGIGNTRQESVRSAIDVFEAREWGGLAASADAVGALENLDLVECASSELLGKFECCRRSGDTAANDRDAALAGVRQSGGGGCHEPRKVYGGHGQEFSGTRLSNSSESIVVSMSTRCRPRTCDKSQKEMTMSQEASKVSMMGTMTCQDGKADEMAAVLAEMVAAAAGEPGVEIYSYHRGEGNTFSFFALMASQEAMHGHGQSEAMQAAMAKFMPLMAEPPQMAPATPIAAVGFDV